MAMRSPTCSPRVRRLTATGSALALRRRVDPAGGGDPGRSGASRTGHHRAHRHHSTGVVASPGCSIRTTRQNIVNSALSKQGASYVWGGSGPDAFDCSGFVMWVYQQTMGMTLPHFSGAQMDVATPVTGKLRRGDLLFYGPDGSQHVSIYIGKGMQVGANNPRTGVVIDSVANSYWAERYVGAGRIKIAG